MGECEHVRDQKIKKELGTENWDKEGTKCDTKLR